MCEPSLETLKACSKPICDRVDEENQDTMLPIQKPKSRYWLNDATRNSWGISIWDRETIGRERCDHLVNGFFLWNYFVIEYKIPKEAEGLKKSGW